MNLAPHSFFTISSVQPPVVQFTSVGAKDSLRNATATGEFVSTTPGAVDLHINANLLGTLASNRGTTLSGITTDIDGDPRNQFAELAKGAGDLVSA